MFPVVLNDESFDDSNLEGTNIYYLIANDGIYLRKNIQLTDSLTKVNNISFLKEAKKFAKLKVQKIPFITFKNICHFLFKCYNEYRAEGVILLYYNKEKNHYYPYCPKQEVSGGTVRYSEVPSAYEIGEGYCLLSSIHSHMHSSFHSYGDDNDEKFKDGLHMTFGCEGNNIINISCSIVMNGERFMVDPRDYIEKLEETAIINQDETFIYTTKSKFLIPEKHDSELVDIWFKNVEKIDNTKNNPFVNGNGLVGYISTLKDLNLKRFDSRQWLDLFDEDFGFNDNNHFLTNNDLDLDEAMDLEEYFDEAIQGSECSFCHNKEHMIEIISEAAEQLISDDDDDEGETFCSNKNINPFEKFSDLNKKQLEQINLKNIKVKQSLRNEIWNSGLSLNEKQRIISIVNLI